MFFTPSSCFTGKCSLSLCCFRDQTSKDKQPGFPFSEEQTQPAVLLRRRGTIFLCLLFSLEENLAPTDSATGRHLESGLAKGSVAIRNHKSVVREWPYGGPSEWQGNCWSSGCPMCCHSMQWEPVPLCAAQPWSYKDVTWNTWHCSTSF